MRKKLPQLFFFLFLSIIGLSVWYYLYSHQNKWSYMARTDLEAIHSILKTQTPGAVDVKNPQYAKWMNDGLKNSLKMAKDIKSTSGYYFVLQYYLNGFHDAHLHFINSKPQTKKSQYPGFIIHYLHKHFFVSKYGYISNQNLPPIGAELISCDNKSPATLIKENVFPFFGNQKLETGWVQYIPMLLTNLKNPWIKIPRICKFKTHGEIITQKLEWSDIDTNKLYKYLHQAAYSYFPKIGMSKLGDDGLWVSLGTFWPNNPKQAKPLQKIVNTISKYRKNNPIVFDLRGNSGGNYKWGEKILQNLYGRDYFKFISDKNVTKTFSEWRVSKGNAEYIKNYFLPLIGETIGKQSNEYDSLKKLALRILSAVKRHKKLVRLNDSEDNSSLNKLTHKSKNPLPGQVYLLTDGRCISACLDFIDQAVLFPHVTLIGASTGADTYYTEVRTTKLPSKQILQFPMAVMRNRNRLSNQPYLPKHIFPGDINNTQALKNWVLQNFQSWPNKKRLNDPHLILPYLI